MKKMYVISCFIWLSFGFISTANAEDATDHESVFVIQDRIYDKHHEIGALLGHIPDDDFHNAYPMGINYVFNFDEHYAWEVIRAEWVVNQEKDIVDDLKENFGVQPSEFDEFKYMIHSNFIVKPTYGKDAVWNKWVVNHETYLLAGAGIAGFERKYGFGDNTTESALSISLGVGRKYFINQKFCINLELRDYTIFKDDKTVNNLYFGVSLGYRFELSPRKEQSEKALDSVYRYLKDQHEDSEK